MRTSFVAALAALGAAGICAPATAQECDRDCIIDITDIYLAAVAANDPSAAPLADDVAFVENIFKIGPEGEVHEIEAVGFTAPYDSPTGWE